MYKMSKQQDTNNQLASYARKISLKALFLEPAVAFFAWPSALLLGKYKPAFEASFVTARTGDFFGRVHSGIPCSLIEEQIAARSSAVVSGVIGSTSGNVGGLLGA